MAHRRQDRGTTPVALIGSNRGGHAFVNAVPARETGQAVARWTFIDPKPERAERLARIAERRFPMIRTAARVIDGREALPHLVADHTVIVAAVDTIASTNAIVESSRANTCIFQIVGRAAGPTMTAPRIGISGLVRSADPYTHAQARLLLEGFETIAAEASSRVLTSAASPVTASVLGSLRAAASRQSARYFADVLRGEETADPPLTLFTSSSTRFPLIVHPSNLADFMEEEEQALALVDAFETQRSGVIAAVALVALEDRAIDLLFVSQERGTDRRRVERVMPFRAAKRPFDQDTTFTD
jgi:hypothetical protein